MNTPSSCILAGAAEPQMVVDSLGRRLSVRRLTALDKLRLFKAAGPTLVQNSAWIGLALLAASVTAIDDVPMPFPATEAQIEALVAKLGEDGLTAVAKAVVGTPQNHAEVVTALGN